MQYLSGILRGRSSSSTGAWAKPTEAQLEQAGQLAQDVVSLFKQGAWSSFNDEQTSSLIV